MKSWLFAQRLSEYVSSCGNEKARAKILAFPNYVDLMTREFKYHRSCYQDICRPKKSHKTNPAENSISKLKQYIEDVVLKIKWTYCKLYIADG